MCRSPGLYLGLFGVFALVGCSDHNVSDALGGNARGATILTTESGGGGTTSSTAGDDDDDDDDDDGTTTGTGDDDDDDDDDGDGDRADLPYDARLDVGDTFVLWDAFAEEGALPAAIVSAEMDDGGTWRLSELQSLTPFTVDQADCDHDGNRATGRDRIEVTWENADGSQETDHLDLRYCGA